MELKVNAILSQLQTLVAQLLPHHCLLCGQRAEARLCPGCHAQLPWNPNPCQQCGLPLSQLHDNPHTNQRCGACLRKPPAFQRTWAALCYQPPVAPLLNQFKHQRNLVSGQLLAQLLGDYLAEHQALAGADALVPVPLHWRRHWHRTFNQSAFLAQQLSRQLQLPWLTPLRRIHPTPRQQGLSRRQRLRNLRGAFVLNDHPLQDRHLVVVDDVMTTGATAQALATLLKEAGAARVDFCCVARTPKPGKP